MIDAVGYAVDHSPGLGMGEQKARHRLSRGRQGRVEHGDLRQRFLGRSPGRGLHQKLHQGDIGRHRVPKPRRQRLGQSLAHGLPARRRMRHRFGRSKAPHSCL